MLPETYEPLLRSSPESGRWWSGFRRRGEAAVFHVDLVPHAGREAAALAWLDDAERSRFNRFRHAGRRREFALCRSALRSVLGARLGCPNAELSFRETQRGKPFAVLRGAPAPVSFSVSHSGRHGLIAVAREGRLGVDVEERVPRRDLDALAEAVLSPDERAEVESAGGSRRYRLFYRLWTVKEALVKALGEGVHRDMGGLEVPAALRRGVTTAEFRFPHLPEVRWRVEDLGTEQFAAALAHELREHPGTARAEPRTVER